MAEIEAGSKTVDARVNAMGLRLPSLLRSNVAM
jgi:hypothetical protein